MLLLLRPTSILHFARQSAAHTPLVATHTRAPARPPPCNRHFAPVGSKMFLNCPPLEPRVRGFHALLGGAAVSALPRCRDMDESAHTLLCECSHRNQGCALRLCVSIKAIQIFGSCFCFFGQLRGIFCDVKNQLFLADFFLQFTGLNQPQQYCVLLC